jgi:hypothetical protein
MLMPANNPLPLPIEAERVTGAPAHAPKGPSFELIEETTWEELERAGRRPPFDKPVLVKGGIHHWPAWKKWSFEFLADVCAGKGSEVPVKFTDGLVEQGVTKGRPFLPVAPYLRELGKAAQRAPDPMAGLLPKPVRDGYKPGERFHLNWAHMQSFKPTTLYLAQWDILEKYPELRRDLLIKSLWPGRMTWEYVFMGPANTVTGLHNDFPHNWFVQLQGVKEFILFSPDQRQHMCPAAKYDWGATLSDINVSRLPEQVRELASFEKAHGYHARVEAGDALFIPRRTWHSVVSAEPSISLGMFGLTPWEVATGGAWATLRDWAHHLHLYAWGNCTCHQVLPKRS